MKNYNNVTIVLYELYDNVRFYGKLDIIYDQSPMYTITIVLCNIFQVKSRTRDNVSDFSMYLRTRCPQDSSS